MIYFLFKKKTLSKQSKNRILNNVHSFMPKFSHEFTNNFNYNNQNEQLIFVCDGHSHHSFPFYEYEINNVKELLKQKLKFELTGEQVKNFCNNELSKYFLNNNNNNNNNISKLHCLLV